MIGAALAVLPAGLAYALSALVDVPVIALTAGVTLGLAAALVLDSLLRRRGAGRQHPTAG